MSVMMNVMLTVGFVSQSWFLVPSEPLAPYVNGKYVSAAEKKAADTVFTQSHLSFKQPSYQSSDVVVFDYVFENQSLDTQVDIQIELVQNNALISATSDNLNADIHLFSDKVLNWQGTLLPPKLSTTPFLTSFFGYIPLQATFNIGRQACRLNCVDNVWHWQFPFTFQGRSIQDFYVDARGAVYFEPPLMGAVEPKAFIKPLFIDSAAYSREVRFAELIDQYNQVYLVIEWTQLRNEQQAARYQLIIEEHSENIWFNYLDKLSITDERESLVSGMQNQAGLVSYAFNEMSGFDYVIDNQEGENTTFKLINQAGEMLTLNGEIALHELASVNTSHQYNLQEDSDITVSIDDFAEPFLMMMKVTHSQQPVGQLQQESVPVYLQQPINLARLVEPQYGQLSLLDTYWRYIPVNNFSGEDAFSYQWHDNFVSVQPSTVALQIDAVNDPPSVQVVEPLLRVFSGERVGLSAHVSDIDSSAVSLAWVQISGPSVAIKHDEQGSYFVAPELNMGVTEQIQLKAVAYDDLNAANSSVMVIEVKSSRQSAGLIDYLLILLCYVGVKRRIKVQ